MWLLNWARQRERSRSPRGSPKVAQGEPETGPTVPGPAPEELLSPPAEVSTETAAAAEPVSGQAETPEEPEAPGEVPQELPDPQPQEPGTAFSCFGCHECFSLQEELLKHLEDATSCSGPAWQAAVSAVASLPGAGTHLWCPACPDGAYWTGPATRAPAFLKHCLSTAASDSSGAAHSWLLKLLMGLVLEEPPGAPEELEEWAQCSKLAAVAGPLLARPGAQGRLAVQQELLNTLQGVKSTLPLPEPFGHHLPSTEAAAPIDDEEDLPPLAGGPGYDLYGGEIPLDVVIDIESSDDD